MIDGRWADFEQPIRGQWNGLSGSVFSGTWHELRLSGLPWIMKRVGEQKLNAILGKSVEPVYLPRWETDWDEAQEKKSELAKSQTVVMSLWPYTQRRRPYVSRDREFGPRGESPFISDEGLPLLRDRGVWGRWIGSPARQRAPGRDLAGPHHQVLQREDWQQAANWVWRFQDQQRTPNPFHIDGLAGSQPDGEDANGKPFWDYWQWQTWSFGGALIDEDQYSPEENERLAGDKSEYFPLLLDDPAAGVHTRWGAAAWRIWEVLGFAWKSPKARVWSRVFSNPNPTKASMSYAQVRIYNPAGWNLWSQHWRVKLVPATHLLDVDVGRFDGDYEKYAALGRQLSPEDFRPVRRLYERLPTEGRAGGLFNYADSKSPWVNRPVVNH